MTPLSREFDDYIQYDALLRPHVVTEIRLDVGNYTFMDQVTEAVNDQVRQAHGIEPLFRTSH